MDLCMCVCMCLCVLALFSQHFEKSFCTLMSLQCELHFYRTRFPLQIGIPQLNRYMLNLPLMMNLLTFPLYDCAFYMMVLCAKKRLQHQVLWQYTKQTGKVVLMVISLTCQMLLLRTYALGADNCATQYNQPKNTFAENCALDNAQAEVVQLCIRLCFPLSFVVLHAMLFLDQWMNFWRMWFHMCSCPLHRFFWLFSSSKLLHCAGMASLTPRSLAHKCGTGAPGGNSKKQAGGFQKFLIKEVQLLAKLSLKNALDIRKIQSTVLTTAILNQDDLYIQAATAATEEINKHKDQAKAGNGEP